MSRSVERIPTLDGWRAIAILMVLISHAGTAFYTEADYYRSSPTRYGTLGVDTFFGLSGLLICKLLLEEHRRNGSISLKRFYIRRSFRILPPCLAVIAVAALAGLVKTNWELASCLFFFRNYLPEHLGGRYTAHLWSLAVEEHFYLIWPGLLLWAGLRRAPRVAVSLALVCAVWRAVELRLNAAPGIGGRTDMRFDALLWGCVMAFVLDSPRSREWLGRHFGISMWLLAIAAFVACVLLHPPMAPMWMAMLIPLLLAGTVVHPDWVFSRVLDTAPLRSIGTISYSLYLWQQLFLAPNWGASTAVEGWHKLPFGIIGTLACAAASYYLLERPMIRLGHQLAGRAGHRAARPELLVRNADASS